MQVDDLDKLLTRSDPTVELTHEERRLLVELSEQSAPASKRRFARPVAVGAIAAILVAGGGLAAAAANDLWSPWAQNDPLAAVHYVLPSGATCEYRIGNLQQAPDEVAEAIRDALAGVTFTDRDVVAGAEHVGVTADPLSDDNAYFTGLVWAIQLRIDKALSAHDLDGQWDSLEGEGFCS